MPALPVGLSRDLPPKRVMRATVGGRDLVVWRATDGEIAAWDNRCPHRGMALSHGFVRGNRLACLYHGWHYERGGRCSYIPAHPDLDPPATIKALRFSVVEAGGVIWVDTDETAQPGAVPPAMAPLRSFFVRATKGAVDAACEATVFESQLPKAAGAGLYELGATQILILKNPMRTSETQVTLLTGPDLALPVRKALSRWGDAMRRSAEAAKREVA